LKEISIIIIVWMGLLLHTQGLAAVLVEPCEERIIDYSFDRLRYLTLDDAVTELKEFHGFTKIPEYGALEIHTSDDPQFEYTAHSPYYKAYFKKKTVKMVVKDAWVQFELGEELGTNIKSESKKQENAELVPIVEKNSLSIADVYESVDLCYEADTSLLREVLTLKEWKEFERLIQKISWGGIEPEFEEDGSILFSDGKKEILKILPPFMRDAQGTVCEDLHYELVETETGHELHKIIDEKGLEWLKQAMYPIVIDPSVQTFEDAWESSGLQPYGQYFKNLREYVNPANGHLTVTQTDLAIPGRGLDLVISRVYEMPALFYGENPYGGCYEEPPLNVGKGWQLNFPYIGDRYLHLWGGALYKIEWVNNTFENHEGSHFILRFEYYYF